MNGRYQFPKRRFRLDRFTQVEANSFIDNNNKTLNDDDDYDDDIGYCTNTIFIVS